MLRGILAIIGVLMMVAAVCALVALYRAHSSAVAMDKASRPRSGPINLLLELRVPKRVMSIDEDQAVTVVVSNQGQTEQSAPVSISAPNLSVEEEAEWTLPPDEPQQRSYIIHAEKAGYFHVLVHVEGYEVIRGISVRDFGLPAAVLKWLGVLFAFLGPASTLPWILNATKEWRKPKQPKSKLIIEP